MTEPSKEIARFADVAMFQAEPIDVQAGPQVHLLSMNHDPLGSVAAACKMYKGEVVRDLKTVTDDERGEYLEQITKTKLKAPFEFVKFHFLIEGVTRSFTHQLVRQRTAVYAQESLRFAVKDDMPVALPPSLQVEMPEETLNPEWYDLTPIQKARLRWEESIKEIGATYDYLINCGIPAEDARGLLPHNVMTRVHYSTDLRALLDHAGNRLCTQAQFEWRLVFAQIARSIRDYGDNLQAEIEEEWSRRSYLDREGKPKVAWQFSRLADLFAPVCFQTGKCEFKANFDRHCSIRRRVDTFHENGVNPSEWGDQEKFGISSISPVEWLLDPDAARKRA